MALVNNDLQHAYFNRSVFSVTSVTLWLEKVAHRLLCIAAAVTNYSLDLHILLCLGTIYISICHPRVEAIPVILHYVRILQVGAQRGSDILLTV